MLAYCQGNASQGRSPPDLLLVHEDEEDGLVPLFRLLPRYAARGELRQSIMHLHSIVLCFVCTNRALINLLQVRCPLNSTAFTDIRAVC